MQNKQWKYTILDSKGEISKKQKFQSKCFICVTKWVTNLYWLENGR